MDTCVCPQCEVHHSTKSLSLQKEFDEILTRMKRDQVTSPSSDNQTPKCSALWFSEISRRGLPYDDPLLRRVFAFVFGSNYCPLIRCILAMPAIV
eukprot:449618-Amorphochlora_amoeboformis.AAC.1